MARNEDSDLLDADALEKAFSGSEDVIAEDIVEEEIQTDGWEDVEGDENVPGQLAVDVYETVDKLVIKTRVAGIDKQNLDVSLSEDLVLTVSGMLSSSEEAQAVNYYAQECYWGEVARSIKLPEAAKIKEDSVEASVDNGVLTICFEKQKATIINIPVRDKSGK
ncbi:MAG: Hsp20/alpha crystallin family protein [Candidatus Nomurabacteria bacterium]|jgi:HSP20 family protein|nr:Hsp20/alpha crystallin family protein [Candidatus Nomurabacteria bacterium]